MRLITEHIAGNVSNLQEQVDFEQNLKACYHDAVRFSWALAGSKTAGDDLLQDALIRAWKAFPKLRDQAVFKSWLLKIITNTHRSIWRRSWLRNMLPLDQVAEMPAPAGLDFEEREVIRLALGKLPLAQREALILFEVLEMSVTEVAEYQNVSRSAVKSRLARGRTRLKIEYDSLSKPEVYHEPNTAPA